MNIHRSISDNYILTELQLQQHWLSNGWKNHSGFSRYVLQVFFSVLLCCYNCGCPNTASSTTSRIFIFEFLERFRNPIVPQRTFNVEPRSKAPKEKHCSLKCNHSLVLLSHATCVTCDLLWQLYYGDQNMSHCVLTSVLFQLLSTAEF